MKATIDQYISFLLYSHECLVVPGFGAFLTRYYPAEINHATQMMRPPSKRVSFNKRIHENDGLLAKTISKEENISYQQALESIDISVRSWKRMLADGNKVKLEGIGRLYTNDSNNILFSPAIDLNYDVHSFGLGIFRSPAINRDIAIKKSISSAITAHKKEKKEGIKKKKKRKSIRWAAVLIPVAVISISGILYLAGDLPEVKNFSGWVPFSQSSKPAEEPLEKVDIKTTPVEVKKHEVPASESNDPEAEEVNVKTVKPVASIPVSPSNTSLVKPYHIIVGSFKELRNAENYVSQLRAQGYGAYIANGNNGFHRVSTGNFATRNEAATELLQVKNKLNPTSWVYTN